MAQITNVGGSSDFFISKFSTSACSPLAVESFEEKELKIYPNPTYNRLTITNQANKSYTIFNTLGQSIKSGTIDNNESIDVSFGDRGLFAQDFGSWGA